MIKKIITYVLTLAMIFSVFCNPALGYATTEIQTSNITNAKNDPYVAKITNIKSSPISCKTIKISWKKVSGAKGYQVYRYNKEKGEYELYITTKKLYLKNTGLKANTVYRYKVRAYTVQDGEKYYGEFSKVVKCRTEKTDRAKVGELAYSKIGSPYRWAARGPKCFDCSGFVHWVYKNADVDAKAKIPRTNAAGMYKKLKKYKIGSSIKSLKKAQMGDIIFFSYGGRINHVGIYYKDGKMIHAANPKKDVCIEKVSDYNKWGYKVVGIVSILK